VPAVKLTDVSEGGGPEVSSTMTRTSGRIRATVGASGVVGATGWRAPQAPTEQSAATPSQVAGRLDPRDIPGITLVRGELWEVREASFNLEVSSER
jgi:hypothetical protein